MTTSAMSSPPHRAVIENMVRQAVYTRLGKPLPRSATAPNPLVVNISKAADVTLVKTIPIGGGLITVIAKGVVGSVKAAVDAGAKAASKVGEIYYNPFNP